MLDIIQSLGPNPCKDLRSSKDTPAGLTNLGATCYANNILQCLYMNTEFRTWIFSVDSDLLKQHPVLDRLARLFALLHSSKMAFIDSAPFKSLELDNGVQQDSHEFLTLFLSLLERSLRHSKVSNAKSVVQDLFRGSVSHVTRQIGIFCEECNAQEDKGIHAEIAFKNSSISKVVGSSKEMPISVDDLLHYHEEVEDELEARRPSISSSPEVVMNALAKGRDVTLCRSSIIVTRIYTSISSMERKHQNQLWKLLGLFLNQTVLFQSDAKEHHLGTRSI